MKCVTQVMLAVLLMLSNFAAQAQSCPVIPFCPPGQGVIGIDPVLGTVVCDTVTTEVYSRVKRYIPGDIDPTLATYNYLGTSMTSFQDIDGDGRRELVVSAFKPTGMGVLLMLRFNADFTLRGWHEISAGIGGFTGTPSASGRFGSGVANLGDINGDGIEDLVVGEPASPSGCNGCGAVWMLFMTNSGLVSTHQRTNYGTTGLQALSSHAQFGSKIASLGDIDSDGVPDVAASALGAFNGFAQSGGVYILRLNSNGTVKASTLITQGSGSFPDSLPSSSFFGFDLAGMGDIDADGKPELAVAQQFVNSQPVGRVTLLSLNTDGTVSSVLSRITQNSNFPGNLASSQRLAISLANFGDLNGDGRAEMAIGRGFDTLYITQLNSAGLIAGVSAISNDDHYLVKGITNVSIEFASSSTKISDFNGDGLPEIAVGMKSDRERTTVPQQNGAIVLFELNNNVR